MMKGESFRITAAIVAAALLGVSGGMFTFPKPQAAFAFDPNEHSGENQYPERATDVKPRDDERWVNYDRGDQTDWLKIKANASPEQQLVTTIEFTRIEGTLLLEVFQDDPYATPVEGYEISAPQVYHIVNRGKGEQYFKIHAIGQGALAQYTFRYEQVPFKTAPAEPSLDSTKTPVVTPTVLPEITATPSPTPAFTPSPTNTPVPQETEPTPFPTVVEMPTAANEEEFAVSTPTPEPTPMPTNTPTPQAENTPIPLSTVVEMPTATTEVEIIVSTPTPKPTATPTTEFTTTPEIEPFQPSDSRKSQTFFTAERLFWAGFSLSGMLLSLTLFALLLRAKRQAAAEKRPQNEILTSAEYKMLGDLAAGQGKLPLAERCYRKLVELEPYNWAIRYDLGYFLFQSQRYKEAIKEFHAYLRHEIIVPDVYAYLGYAYLMTKDLTRAEEFYRKFVELTPDNPDGYVGLGVIAQSRSQYQQAHELYKRALSCDPNCQEARQNIRQIQPYL